MVFIIDMYHLQKLSQDENLLQLVTDCIKTVFMDPKIRKVFFDGKKDLEALHYLMGFGIQNFVDVQIGHMAFTQLKEFHKNKKMNEVKNVVTPGLNDVLSKHEVTHGINTLKTKFKVKIFNF
jgi:ribonuclease D